MESKQAMAISALIERASNAINNKEDEESAGMACVRFMKLLYNFSNDAKKLTETELEGFVYLMRMAHSDYPSLRHFVEEFFEERDHSLRFSD